MVVIVWLIKLVSDMALHMRGRHGRDRMVDVFSTTCAISAYHH